MGRFHLRPLFRRLSSKHSIKADSTSSDNSDTTAATSAPSPNAPPQPGLAPRKSASLAKLRDKFRAQDSSTDIPEVPQDHQLISAQSNVEQQAPRTLQQSSTTPVVPQEGQPQRRRQSRELAAISVSKLPPTQTLASTPATSTSERNLNHQAEHPSPPDLKVDVDDLPVNPRLILEEPTPEALGGDSRVDNGLDLQTRRSISGDITLVPSTEDLVSNTSDRRAHQPGIVLPASPTASAHSFHLPADADTDEQCTAPISNAKGVNTPFDAPAKADRPHTSPHTGRPCADAMNRKIWVKRPNASATLVQIKEDDLVDDVRDMILRKYANSLGKTFDAPDMTLRIVTRADNNGHRTERVLGPEEEMSRTIDTQFPGGQTVEDALIIDVPHKRTPRPSPRHYNAYHVMDDLRPQETGTDYFPPMPAVIQPTLPHAAMQQNSRDHHLMAADHPRSISVLNTGQVPPLPSPGGRRHRAEREHRPKFGRQHTSSPTIITHTSVSGPGSAAAPNTIPGHMSHRTSNRPRVDSSASEAHHPNGVPAPPPLPTPPAPEAPPTGRPISTPPTPLGGAPQSAHRDRRSRPGKSRKLTPEKMISKNRSPAPDAYGTNLGMPNLASMLDGSVPPINVLIVEDNIINLRILEGLMKRLKVRWQTAMNGQIAVDKWKTGGYHLVLMDIQMPIMNGLQATKEIRRLERVNGIGVFSSSTPGSPNDNTSANANGDTNGTKSHDPDDDRLRNEDGLFKSPVIIVALTASSLQSDRHEALAAGCNDFLTKPVSFVWLERKVKEWGCMQALIDFDGWREWKNYAALAEEGKTEEEKTKEREKEKLQEEKDRIRAEKMAKLQEKQRLRKEEEDAKKKAAATPAVPEEETVAVDGS